MTDLEKLAAELAAAEGESAALDELDGNAEERAMRAKLRATKLENIARKAAKKVHGRVFAVDMDKESNAPATVVFQGQDCVLHTQFIVRGGTAKELDAFQLKLSEVDDDDPKKHDKRKAITRELIIRCLVFPVQGERSPAFHALDLAASFDRFGALELTLSDEIASLGGMIAKANRKSIG